MASAKKPISLQVNCGYGRCAMRLTTSNWESDTLKFKELFETTPNYGLCESYFATNSSRQSQFKRHCNLIKTSWSKRWCTDQSFRINYEATFSKEKWKNLSLEEQQSHTLADCNACYNHHKALQKAFPLIPQYELEEPVVTINKKILEDIGKADGTKQAITVLNQAFKETFEKTFVESMVKLGGQGVQVLNY